MEVAAVVEEDAPAFFQVGLLNFCRNLCHRAAAPEVEVVAYFGLADQELLVD